MLGNNNALGSSNGALTVNGGTLDLAAYSPTVGNLSGTGLITNINGGASTVSLTVNQSANTSFIGQIADGATYGVGVIALVKSGSGTLTLANANAYSGGTTVQAGELQLANAAALGTGVLAINGGTLDLGGYGVTVPSFSGSGGLVTNSVAANIALIVSQSINTNYSGQLADGGGTLALVKQGNGMLTLGPTSAPSTYSGGTTVQGGTLQLNVNAINALGTGGLTANGGLVDLHGNSLLLTNTNAYNNTNALTSLSGSGGAITDN